MKLACVLSAFLVCVGIATARDITLNSGRILKEVFIGPVLNKTGVSDRLIMDYHTTVDIDSPTEVTAEVDELWLEFRPVAEKGGYKAVEIGVFKPLSKSKSKKGVAVGVRFVYEKQDSEWVRRLPPKWQAKKKSNKR